MGYCATYSKEVMPLINSILTNTVALTIRNNLNSSNSQLSRILERMSSGTRINSAKDAVADYVISAKLKNKISGTGVAKNNLSHGENLLNIADSVLDNMVGQVTRIRDLCLQAKNSTLGEEELKAIQEEINQISYELERQRQTTKYNDAMVFETKEIQTVEVKKPYEKRLAYIESTGTQYIDTGYVPNEDTEIVANVAFLEKTNDLQQYGCITNEKGKYARWHFGVYRNNLTAFKTTQGSTGDIEKAYDSDFHEYYLSNSTAGLDDSFATPSNTKNSNVSFTLFARNGNINVGGKAQIGYYSKSRLQDFKIYDNGELIHSYIPVADYDGRAALYDEITGKMLYNQGSGEFVMGEEVEDITEVYDAVVDKAPTVLQVGSEAGVDNTISINLGFEFGNLEFDISNFIKADFGINKANDLIEALTKKRASVGAVLNRTESISHLQDIDKLNLSATRSNLADTDMAQESTNLVQTQILQQVSSSLFSQANQINGNLALRLLGAG